MYLTKKEELTYLSCEYRHDLVVEMIKTDKQQAEEACLDLR